ncbi:CDK2-associated and cullin domain-containing protein 1 isoform X1 [Electrophorus electricus]|uniref:Cullin N-terminal domain-containing protein n=1 Tax=Electrophorus electricus TaxID=8005 RepID=A0A4W4GBH1_ELEEL|nr:CDK2-associated and cullin domain-containing protein 1 isoform X1 [Electrophorus electricus]
MEEAGCLEVNDDHNHNCRETQGNAYYSNCRSHMAGETHCCPPVFGVGLRVSAEEVFDKYSMTEPMYESDSSSEASECDSYGVSTSNAGRLSFNSPSNFLMNVITVEDYKKAHWPKLERAIEHLLTQSPMDHISISYEQIYSHVYKCVCQQHSELLYNDLMQKITSHLQQVSLKLQKYVLFSWIQVTHGTSNWESPPESLIENFNHALIQYTFAHQCIVSVFIYMNKFYIETKLNRDLKDDLMKLFSDYVAEKHVDTLIPLLKNAHAMPFQVKPSTMESVVKGLYALRPDWAPLAPALFSRFIPQIHPPALESQLLHYAAQDQKLQMELSLNGFSRGDQSRKRSSEES